MNCALGDLSASELNAAIDDTNFPKNNNVENGKKIENGDGANGGVIKTFRIGSFKRDVPAPLIGAVFNDNYSDVPTTPKTPRTTTTPGKIKYFHLVK